MKKSKVLVTGANGFIGKETLKHLAGDNWAVFPTMRNSPNPEVFELDLESPNLPLELKALPKVNAIVHLAARVAYAGESLDELFRANIAATSSLLLLAKEMDAFFVFSSAALISGTKSIHIDSSSLEIPDTEYMKSKLLAEELIKASGVRHSILRIGGVFGLDGPEHLGLNRAIKAVVHTERPIQVGLGNAKRNYIYVKDVAAVIAEVLSKQIEGTHLVAGREETSISEMLVGLCDVFHIQQGPESVDGAIATDQLITPSDAFTPSRSFRDAVLDIYQSAMK